MNVYFNNVYFNKIILEKIVLFFLVIVSLLFITSCTDTLGTDPKVKITPVNSQDNGGKDTVVNSKFAIQSNWDFSEYYEVNKKGFSFQWNNNINEIRNSFLVDTTNQKITIWIDYEVESTIPDEFIKFRMDRITSFRLSVDSLILDLNSPNKNYSNIKSVRADIQIKEMMGNRKTIINSNELGMIFSIHRNPNSGNLEGFVNLDIFPFFPYQTYKFQIAFIGLIP